MRRCEVILAAATMILVVGCVTGTRSEDKTGLDRLNGENYLPDSSAAVMAQPVIPVILGDQRARTTKVSGTVWRGEGISRSRVSLAQVQVKKDDKVLAEVNSQPNGDFKIFQVLPNGRYVLHVKFGGQQSELPFTVTGYEVRELDITLGAP